MKSKVNIKHSINLKRKQKYFSRRHILLAGALLFVTGMFGIATTSWSHKVSKNKTATGALNLQKLNMKQVDSLDISELSPESIVFLLGQAAVLKNDTIDKNNRVKSYMIEQKVADYFTKDLKKDKNTDLNTPAYRFIISYLETRDYHLNLNPPSKMEKLIHYLKEGNYQHIWNRIRGKNLHVYAGVFVLLLTIVTIIFKVKNIKIQIS